MSKQNGFLTGQENQLGSPTQSKTSSKSSNTNESEHKLPFGAIFAIAEEAGIEFLKGSNSQKKQIRCVFPENHNNGDKKPSAFLSGKYNCFSCSGCGESLSLKSFAARLDVSSSIDLSSYAEDESGDEPIDYSDEILSLWSESKKQTLDMSYNKPILDFLQSRKYNVERIFESGIMRILPLSYDFPDFWLFPGMERYRIALLNFDAHGDPISFQARSYKEDDYPKCRYPTGLTASGYFMNRAAQEWAKNPRKISTVLVTEGLTDTICMSSMTELPVIGITSGSKIPELPWHLTDSCINFIDKDLAGQKYSDKLKNLPTKIEAGKWEKAT